MVEPIRVVLVDDDPGVLRALGMLLTAIGYTVQPFSSAQAALPYIASTQEIDVVVTDLRMPEQSGEDLLLAVQRARPELPCVVMSGHATPTEVQRLSTLGMGAFLPKPFTPVAFNDTVRKLVAREASTQPERRASAARR